VVDARRQEVYWGIFTRDEQTAQWTVAVSPRVSTPARVTVDAWHAPWAAVGSGVHLLPKTLRDTPACAAIAPPALAYPHAAVVACLAQRAFNPNLQQRFADAQPLYLRDAL